MTPGSRLIACLARHVEVGIDGDRADVLMARLSPRLSIRSKD